MIGDLVSTAGNLRILLLERPVSEAHLADHARRTGLLDDSAGPFEQDEVMAALRHQFEAEVARLRQEHRHLIQRNTPDQTRAENILGIGHFLRTPRGPAEAIARALEAVA